jgi:hypothetical protein
MMPRIEERMNQADEDGTHRERNRNNNRSVADSSN